MRLKLFLASLLACGFIVYAIANENISNAEIESIATSPKTNTDKNVKIQQQPQKLKEQPKVEKILDKSEAVEMIEAVKPKITNGNMTLARSGALQMFDDYLGELGYEITDSGYNWSK